MCLCHPLARASYRMVVSHRAELECCSDLQRRPRTEGWVSSCSDLEANAFHTILLAALKANSRPKCFQPSMLIYQVNKTRSDMLGRCACERCQRCRVRVGMAVLSTQRGHRAPRAGSLFCDVGAHIGLAKGRVRSSLQIRKAVVAWTSPSKKKVYLA